MRGDLSAACAQRAPASNCVFLEGLLLLARFGGHLPRWVVRSDWRRRPFVHLALSLPAEGSVLRMRARGAPASPLGLLGCGFNGSSLNASGRPGRTPWAASGSFPAAAVALSGCNAKAGSLHRAGIKPKAGPSRERPPPGLARSPRELRGGVRAATPPHLAEVTEQVSGGAGI